MFANGVTSRLVCIIYRTARERFASQRFTQKFEPLDGKVLVDNGNCRASVRELRDYQVDGINWLRERWWRHGRSGAHR